MREELFAIYVGGMATLLWLGVELTVALAIMAVAAATFTGVLLIALFLLWWRR